MSQTCVRLSDGGVTQGGVSRSRDPPAYAAYLAYAAYFDPRDPPAIPTTQSVKEFLGTNVSEWNEIPLMSICTLPMWRSQNEKKFSYCKAGDPLGKVLVGALPV